MLSFFRSMMGLHSPDAFGRKKMWLYTPGDVVEIFDTACFWTRVKIASSRSLSFSLLVLIEVGDVESDGC